MITREQIESAIASGNPFELRMAEIIRQASLKFREHRVKRYYILTTADPYVKPEDLASCQEEIRKIQQTLGCQVIVNGVMPTIWYYLRLLKDPSEFFPVYAQLLKTERSIKYEHRNKWNKIIEQ
jgi:DNA (cytosine-5)-methyltransferase 1